MWFVRRTRRLDGQWPRDVVQATCVTWMRDCCGCSSCAQKAWFKFELGLQSSTRQTREQRWSICETNDLAFERNTPSTADGLELMDGGHSPHDCRDSKRLPCTNLEREEYERSGWFRICVGMVIVILMLLSGEPFENPIGLMTEVGRRRRTIMLRNYVQWKMSSSIMRRCPDPDSLWNLIKYDAELWAETDFGQTDFGHPYFPTLANPILTNSNWPFVANFSVFVLTDFGQL